MAFRQGLFDSTEIVEVVEGYPQGDNAETADFFADTIHSILGDGVSLVPTSSCNVIVKSGMIVTVKAGKLYKNGYKAWLTEDLDITLTSSSSEQTLYIGVRLDVINNEFTGDNVAARTDFDADADIVTAIIVIPADAVVITDDMITDTRYSTTYCGVVDQYRISLAAIVEEFEDALAEMVAGGIPAHATEHENGGGDELTPANLGTNGVAELNSDGVIQALECAVAVSAKTDNYTVELIDVGKDIQVTADTAKTVTIPPQASVAFGDFSYFFITRLGAGSLTIVAGAGVTLHSAGSRLTVPEQYKSALATRESENVWLIRGV